MWANLGMLCFRPRIARACEAAREAGAEATGNGESQICRLIASIEICRELVACGLVILQRRTKLIDAIFETILSLLLPRLTGVRQIPFAHSLDTGYPITSKRPMPHSNSVKGLFLPCFIHSAKPGRGGCTCQHLGLSSTLSIYEAEAGQMWDCFCFGWGNADRKKQIMGEWFRILVVQQCHFDYNEHHEHILLTSYQCEFLILFM